MHMYNTSLLIPPKRMHNGALQKVGGRKVDRLFDRTSLFRFVLSYSWVNVVYAFLLLWMDQILHQ